jgi:hypothetical protein
MLVEFFFIFLFFFNLARFFSCSVCFASRFTFWRISGGPLNLGLSSYL